MSDVITTTTTRPRFLDELPELDRRHASSTFYRAVRRVGDPERAVQLAAAWLDADLITLPDAYDRLRRLRQAIEDEPELALDYARDVARRLQGEIDGQG